jgi:hypothetical protein
VTDGDEMSAVDVYALVDVDVETTSAEDLSSSASLADAEFSEESTSETEEQDERHARVHSAWETDIYGSEATPAPATLSAYVEVEPADEDEPMAPAGVDARTDGIESSSYYVEVDDSDDGVAPKNENEESEARSESGDATECRSSWMETEVYERQSAYEEPSNYQELDVAPVPMAKDAPSKKKTKEKKTKEKTSPIRPSPSSALSTSSSLPLGAYAIPVPPPPPPPLLHLSLAASTHSSSSRAAVAEEESTNDNIYHYMKKQQKTKGSVIIQPQGQRPLATQHGTTT